MATTNPQPKIVLHWLENSRAQRIAWLLEELSLPYELQIYKRINNVAPPELKAIHPLGKSPVVTINDLVLAESGFIIEYFTNTYSKLQPPPTSPANTDYKYLLHFGEGSLMPPLTIGYIMQSIKTSPAIPFFIRPITNMIVKGVYDSYLNSTYEGNFKYLEGLLEGREWFVGDEFSGVDVLLSYPMLAAAKGRVENFDENKYPNLFGWMERIQKRPAFQRAVERTREYEPKA